MRGVILLLVMTAVLASCHTLPRIESVEPSLQPTALAQCQLPFLTEKYRLIHAIEATLPDGSTSLSIGIIIADPVSKAIKSVVMSPEGFILLDVEIDENRKIMINSGVSPLDSKEFAERMLEDIRLLFFLPEGELMQSGRSTSKVGDYSYTCRYKSWDGSVVDLVAGQDGVLEILKYNNKYHLLRMAKAFSLNEKRFPERLELRAYGLAPYTLQLKLLEAESMKPGKQ